MPELPEVETIKNGLLPHLQHKVINNTIIRQRQLRWPIPKDLKKHLKDKTIINIERRSKYLIFHLKNNPSAKNYSLGKLIVHLGMSGNLRLVNKNQELKKHDHVDIELNNNKILRYNDPRRFGAILWIDNDNLNNHERFKHLGPEPLTDEFNSEYMINKAQSRQTPTKNFIMNNQIVVGVGNIYATEALFYAGISPFKPVCEIKPQDWYRLVTEIKKVLTKAIKSGGTTLKDFTNSDGKPGYFKQELSVYGRTGQACIKCKSILDSKKQQGRTTVYCPKCQT